MYTYVYSLPQGSGGPGGAVVLEEEIDKDYDMIAIIITNHYDYYY